MHKEPFTLLLPDYIVIDFIDWINQNDPNNRKSIENLLYSYHTNLNRDRSSLLVDERKDEKFKVDHFTYFFQGW